MFGDLIQVNLPTLCQHEHSVLGKSNLLNLGSSWQIIDMKKIWAISISDSFNLNRAELCFSANIELSLVVDICLMIPTKAHVNDIWLVFTLELLNFLWCEVGVVLGWVHLKSLSVDINICVD